MQKSNRYDYLSYLLELKETSRSNLSKKTKGNSPTKPYEDILFMLDEDALCTLCELHQKYKDGQSASFRLDIEIKEDSTYIESKLSSDQNKYIILENETEIFQTFVPKNKSIRVLFNEFYIEDEIDEILELEATSGFSISDTQAVYNLSIEEQKQFKRIQNNFIQNEHLKYTQMQKPVSFSSKKTHTISIKDYLLNRFNLENLCFQMYEKEKDTLSSLPRCDHYNYFIEKLSFISFVNYFHPNLTRNIVHEWFEKNHH